MFRLVIALVVVAVATGNIITFTMLLFVRVIILFSICAPAFAPTSRASMSTLRMMAPDSLFPENDTPLSAGEVAPTGFFDPVGLSKGKDAATLKQWRDAEIKHGRVCMLASVGLLTQELLKNPLGIDGPAIRHLDLIDEKFPEFGEVFILLCAFIEGWTIINKWEPRSETRGLGRAARLMDDSAAGKQVSTGNIDSYN